MNHKEWEDKNREHVRAYKRAWMRLVRCGSKAPEFPVKRYIRTKVTKYLYEPNKKRKTSLFEMKHKVEMKHKGDGFCINCNSKTKKKYCDYCLKTFPQLSQK